ncbi:hypothetical protein CAEBREN_00474, partial [Caenorhabditis brenneri]
MEIGKLKKMTTNGTRSWNSREMLKSSVSLEHIVKKSARLVVPFGIEGVYNTSLSDLPARIRAVVKGEAKVSSTLHSFDFIKEEQLQCQTSSIHRFVISAEEVQQGFAFCTISSMPALQITIFDQTGEEKWSGAIQKNGDHSMFFSSKLEQSVAGQRSEVVEALYFENVKIFEPLSFGAYYIAFSNYSKSHECTFSFQFITLSEQSH